MAATDQATQHVIDAVASILVGGELQRLGQMQPTDQRAETSQVRPVEQTSLGQRGHSTDQTFKTSHISEVR